MWKLFLEASEVEARWAVRRFIAGVVDKEFWCCKRTSEESGTIGRRKENKFVDGDLTTGKHPTI